MHDLLDGLLGTLTGLDPVVLLLVTGLFTTAETSMLVGMVVPGDTVMLLAGATVTSSARFAALVAVGTLGSLTGETIGYLLGHRFRDQLRNGRIGHRVGEGNWAKAEAFLNGGGGPAVAAARFVAIVHAVLPVVAGTVRMPYLRFIARSATGAVAWSLLYTTIGAVAGASWRAYGERLSMSGYLLLGMLALTLLLGRTMRRRRRAAVGGADAARAPIRGNAPFRSRDAA
jgi:membrane-associated protein